MGIQIVGTGVYVPPMVVENEAFTAFLDTSDEWITSRSGISERRVADGETTVDMGAKAAQKALEDAGVSAQDVDLILVTSVTPDFYTPSMSCIIQHQIGAKDAMCIDLNCACAGCVYAIDMAKRYLETGDVEVVLIIGAERLSQITNYEDRASCVLFGDGAAAFVIKKDDTKRYASFLGADGSGASLLFAHHAERKTRLMKGEALGLPEGFPKKPEGLLYMDGKEVYKFAVSAMPKAVEEVSKKAGIAVDSIDVLVPHQANIRIIQTAAQRLKIPMEKVVVTLDKYANTSSASALIAFDEAKRQGKITPGMRVCFAGFGAGLTYGAVLLDL